MRVFWATAAEQDRADIIDYIGQDNPLAAIRMDEFFAKAAARLAEHPLLGRTGKILGTRELIPHESYRLVYEVDGDIVWILALVHTARLWPLRQS
jgi:toxin ParE1/3/4